MDTDHNGSIDKRELTYGLRAMGKSNPSQEADRIFKLVDLDNNGKIEFTEWCTATLDKG